jgi:hypothetical protein
VVGSSEGLGAWNHDAALELAREEGKTDAWWGRARLERGVECRYKYFIREGAAIAKWESWRENRRLVPLGVELFVDDGRFGVEKTTTATSPSSSPSLTSDVWEDYGWLVSDIQVTHPLLLLCGPAAHGHTLADLSSLACSVAHHARSKEHGESFEASHTSGGVARQLERAAPQAGLFFQGRTCRFGPCDGG